MEITKKISVTSLGCDKNRVDTEHFMGILKNAGFEFTSNENDADIIIINTCAFLQSARREAIDTILQKIKLNKFLVVCGCLPQKYRAELIKELPEVNLWLGIDEYEKLPELLGKKFCGGGRILSTPSHYAYLKISDGCNNACAYCTIPSIRGKYREYPLKSLVGEIKALKCKEVILVAQDLTKYTHLIELIREVSKLQNVQWIRLLYCYPQGVSDELIAEILNNEKVCKYIDIPMQHTEDVILNSINRKNTNKMNCSLMEKLCGKVAIRSTFIVGLPGETKQHFENLLNFLQKYKLTNVGFFEYSREDGTPAASMPFQVDSKIKKQRRIAAEKVQSEILHQINLQKMGKVLKVICDERIDMIQYKCRAEFCAPDIDPYVIVKSKTPLTIGEFYNIKVTGTNKNNLVGEIFYGKE